MDMAGDAIMEMNMYTIQDFSRQRSKDLRREADTERMLKHMRESQREHQASQNRDTRYETQGNSTPLWARIWSLF